MYQMPTVITPISASPQMFGLPSILPSSRNAKGFIIIIIIIIIKKSSLSFIFSFQFGGFCANLYSYVALWAKVTQTFLFLL